MTIWHRIIRIALSISLLFGVYSETGAFTTISIALIFIAAEVLEWQLNKDER